MFKLDIYAVQEQRISEGEEPFATVEETAAHFLEEMLSIQPAGPYFLGGQCEGGIIALEIARQLQRQGREVALLVQFDTAVNGYFRRLHWIQRLLASIVRGEFLDKLRQFYGTPMVFEDPIGPESEQHLLVRDTIWKGIGAYSSDQPFRGRIVLLRAEETYGVYEDVVVGWEKVGTDGLTVHNVGGGHVKLFSDPGAQETIRRILDEAQRAAAR
jgi:thioesterase domain-containing protein